MSTTEKQSDDSRIICPHCLASYQAEAKTYFDFDVEETCEKCGMDYMRCTEFTLTHHTRPKTKEEASK